MFYAASRCIKVQTKVKKDSVIPLYSRTAASIIIDDAVRLYSGITLSFLTSV